MIIDRSIALQVKKRVKHYPIVSLTGPRQSGKTTLVKHLFPHWTYVSLEDPDRYAFAENDPRGFLEEYSYQVILDEIQRAPALFSYLQSHVDNQGKSGQYILTGSQNFLLLEKITQSLAGRVALLELLPLSLHELKSVQLLPSKMEDMLFKGNYPRIYQHAVNPTDWYRNYIQTYIERDVRQIKNITQLDVFQRFLKMCAGRCGQLLNLSSLAHDCGITHNTAQSWLSVLQASFIVYLLQPHHKNFNKRLVKAPKIYFYDTGLVCSLLDIHSASQLTSHYLRGNLFETLIMSELYKLRFNQGIAPNYYFWRDKVGHEIDCVFEKNSKLIAIEIKSGKTINEDYFSGLQYLQKLASQVQDENDFNTNYVIYGGNTNQKRSLARVLSWKNMQELL